MKGSAVRNVSVSKTENPWLNLPIAENISKANTSPPASKATRLKHNNYQTNQHLTIPTQAFTQTYTGKSKLSYTSDIPPFIDERRRIRFFELNDALKRHALLTDEGDRGIV